MRKEVSPLCALGSSIERGENRETRSGFPRSREDSRNRRVNFPVSICETAARWLFRVFNTNPRLVRWARNAFFPANLKIPPSVPRGVFGKSARTTVCDSSVRDAKTRLLAHSSKLSPSFFPSVVIHVRASSLLRAHRTTAVARSPRKRSRIDGSIGPIGPRIALRRSSRGGTRHARLARRVRVPLAILLNV